MGRSLSVVEGNWYQWGTLQNVAVAGSLQSSLKNDLASESKDFLKFAPACFF